MYTVIDKRVKRNTSYVLNKPVPIYLKLPVYLNKTLKIVTFYNSKFQEALNLGLQPSHIRQAIRNNLQVHGRPFRSTDLFIQQVLLESQPTFVTDG